MTQEKKRFSRLSPTFIRKSLRVVCAAALVALSAITVDQIAYPDSAEAAPTPTCGTSGTPALVAQHGPHMYIDSDVGIFSSYVAYTVRAGATSRNGMWLAIGDFAGGVVALASGEASMQPIPTLASGASDTRYFFLTASAGTTVPQTHTLTVWQGPPGTGTAICVMTSTINTVSETIKALANKVDSISTDVPTGEAKIGDAVTVTVQGRTGTLGSGPANDPGVLSVTPSALSNFPAAAWRLEHTEITISPNGVDPAVTITDRLYLPGSSGTDRNYTAKYKFRAVGETAVSAAIKPIQYIASGTQVKHTDPGAIAVGNLPPVSGTAELSIAKTGDKSELTRVSPLTTAERTISYTVTITNTGDGSGTLDKLVDTIPSGSTYVAGSSRIGGRSVANPSYTTATRELSWPGPLKVPAFGSIEVTYKLEIADTVALHRNSVIGTFGNVNIDSTASVSDDAPAVHTVEVRELSGTMTANPDTASTTANTKVTVDVVTNDSSTRAGATKTVQSAGVDTPPSNGVVVVSGTGTVDYTPNGGFSGTDTFSYRVSDGVSSASSTVTVTVSPDAVNDIYSTESPTKNVAINFTTVKANDVCGTCTVAKITEAGWDTNLADYTLTVNSSGTFSLTSTVNNGRSPVKFAYRVTDTVTNLTADARVTVYLSALAPDYASTAYETAVTINVLANDTAKSGSVSIPSGQGPAHGTFNTTSKLYTPDNGYWGTDSFTYKVGSQTSTVAVLIGPPSVTHQMAPDDPPITGDASSANCDSCEFTVVTSPANGIFSLAIGGGYTYSPGISSSNTVTYKVTDPLTGLSRNGTIYLKVGPRAVDDSESIMLPATASGDAVANDTCPATCTATKLTNPSFGSATVNSNGTWTFDPAGQIGVASFTYRIVSSVEPSVVDEGTITVTVDGTSDDTAETPLDTTVNIDVMANDPCVGCALTSVGTASSGTPTVRPDGTVDYSPTAGFSGQATFTYTITKNARSSTSTVTVNVLPEAVDDSVSTTQGATSDIDVMINDICAECTVTAVGSATKGTLSIESGTYIRYTAGASASGLDSFSYTVTDGFGKTSTASVTVSIATAPEPADDSVTTPADTAVIIDVLLNDSCAECTVDKISEPSRGNAAVRVDGKMQFVPSPGSSGVFTFDYSATDSATGLSGTATVTVTVTPLAVDDETRTAIGSAVTVDVRANDACSSCTVTITSDPTGTGNAASVVSNAIRFVPSVGFSGVSTLSYQITDPVTALTSTATLTITVDDASPDAAVTPYTTQVTVSNVLANDTCSGCSLKSLRNVPVGKGSATTSGNSVVYTPVSGVTGLVRFDYDADSSSAGATLTSTTSTTLQRMFALSTPMYAPAATTVSSSVTILVGPPSQTYSVNTYGTKSGDIISDSDPTAAITDTNCPNCTTSVLAAPTHGEISMAEDGVWTYTAPATVQTDTMTYLVTDPVTGKSVEGQMTFNVSEVPTPLTSIGKVAGTINRSVVAPSTRIDSGDTVPFTITVTNSGNVTLTNIEVTDSTLAGLACSATSLVRGASLTCTGTHTFTQAEIDAGVYVNSAAVTASSTAGAPPTATVEVSTSIPRTPGVSLTKSADVAVLPGAGNAVNYTITATNTGNVTLTDVSVTDPGTTVTCPTDRTLAPGEAMACTATHTVTQSEVDSGSYTNEAAVATTSPPGVSNPSATASVTLSPTAPASVSITSVGGTPSLNLAGPTDRLDAGDTVPITTTITNTSIYTLSNFILNDSRLTTSCTPALPTSLAPGDSIVCVGDWEVTQSALNSGEISDDVSVSADATNGATPSDTTTRAIELSRTATLSLAKTADTGNQLPAAGSQVTYTITATNTGNVTLTNVTITDPMFSALSCTPANGSALEPTDQIDCTGTHTVTTAEFNSESLTNNASVTGSAPSGLSDPTASTSLTLTQNLPASIAIEAVAALPDETVAGPEDRTDKDDTVALTTTITNDGPRSLSSIVVTDPLGATICAPELDGLTLAPGEVVTCTGSYTVTQDVLDAGSRTDTVSVTASATNGDAPTDSVDRVITLNRIAGLSVDKVADSGTTLPLNGTSVLYTLTGINTGNVTLTNVTISDPMLSLSCTPANGGSLAPGGSIVCEGTHTVSKAEFYSGSLANTASISGSAPDGVVDPSDTDTLTLTQNQPASIDLSAVAASPANNVVAPSDRTDEGDSVAITTTITNDGPYDLTDIALTDAIGTPNCDTPLLGLTLEPGQSVVCTGEYFVTQAMLDLGSRTDTVSVAANAGNGSALSKDVNRTINLSRVPAVSIAKTPSVTRLPSAGNALSYTFLVTNDGNVTLTNVVVTDINVTSVNCPVGFDGTLAPAESVSCSGSHVVTNAEATAGALTNTATVNADGPTGVGPVSDSDEVTISVDGVIALDITSSVVDRNDTVATPNTRTDESDQVQITTTITNTGEVDFVSLSHIDPYLGECSWDLSAGLAAGQSISCTWWLTLSQTLIDAGTISTGLTVDGATATSRTAQASTTRTFAINHDPIVTLSKTTLEAELPAVASLIAYELTITNTGNVTLNDFDVFDPGAADLVCTPALVSLSLAPGESFTCTASHTVVQADVDATLYTNTATVDAYSPANLKVSDQSSVTLLSNASPGIAITSIVDTFDDAIESPIDRTDTGDTVEVLTTITNTGLLTLTNITSTDSVLTGICDAALADLDLAPEESVTCSQTQTITQLDIDAGALVTADVEVDAETLGGTPVSDSTQRAHAVTQEPQLAINKQSSSANLPLTGDVAEYTIEVTNEGNVTLSGVNVEDLLVSDLTCSPASTGVELAPGDSIACTASHAVTQDDVDAGIWSNTAASSGMTPGGATLNADDTVDLISTAAPELSIASIFTELDNSLVGPLNRTDSGDTVEVRTTITNTGDVTLYNIAASDSVLSDLCDFEIAGISSLAVGDQVVCSEVLTISQGEIDSGSMPSADVDASAETLGGVPVAVSTTRSYTLVRVRDLELSKTALDDDYTASGDELNYEIVAKNTGNVTLTSVQVLDADVESLVCDSQTTLVPDNGDDTNDGEWIICTGVHYVTVDDMNDGSFTNIATASAYPPTGLAQLNRIDSATVNATITAGISLTTQVTAEDDTVTDPSNRVDAGDTRTIVDTITNTGITDLSEISLDDEQTPDNCESSLDGLVLEPGEFIDCEYIYAVDQDDIDDAGTLTILSAAGTSTSGATVMSSTTRSLSLDRIRSSRLSVTVSLNDECPGPQKNVTVDPGELVTVCFELTNSGNGTINDAVILTSTGDVPELISGSMPLGPNQKAMYSMSRPFSEAVKIVAHATDRATIDPFPTVTDTARVLVNLTDPGTNTSSTLPNNSSTAITGTRASRSTPVALLSICFGLGLLSVSRLSRRRRYA